MTTTTRADGAIGQRQQSVLWRDTKQDADEANVVAEAADDKTVDH